MPGLLIKNVPPELHEALKRRAARNHRSLMKEALAVLEAALAGRANRPSAAEMKRLRVRGAKRLTDAIIRRARTTGRP